MHANVLKKIPLLITECYAYEESKLTPEVITFFEKEKTKLEEKKIYVHLKGIGEDLMSSYYRNPENASKIMRDDFTGSTPFHLIMPKNLSKSIPRLDQLPRF